MLNEFINIITKASLPLPGLEITILLVSLTLCLVFRLNRTGLFIAYLFTYRWGWIVFAENSQSFLATYLLFGSVVGILTVAGLLKSPDS